MALGLSLTTRQLLSALDDVALASPTYAQRLNDTLERRLNISADAADRYTAAVGRRRYLSPRTDPAGCWAVPAAGRAPGLDRAARGRFPHRRGPPPAPALPPRQPGHSAAQSLKLLRIPCGTHPMLFSRHSWLIVLSVSALRL